MIDIDFLATGKAVNLRDVEELAYIQCLRQHDLFADRNKAIVSVNEIYGGDSIAELLPLYERVDARIRKAHYLKRSRYPVNYYPRYDPVRGERAKQVLSRWAYGRIRSVCPIYSNHRIPDEMLTLMWDVDLSCAPRPNLQWSIPIFRVKTLNPKMCWIRQIRFRHSVNCGYYFCFGTFREEPGVQPNQMHSADVRYFPINEWPDRLNS